MTADVIAGSARQEKELRQIAGGVDELKDQCLADMQGAQRQALADPEWARRPRRVA